MFNSKKTHLFEVPKATTATAPSTNAFVTAGLKNAAETRTHNGGIAYTTTGNDFVDQFGKTNIFKVPRSYEDISKDMVLLWSQDRLKALRFSLFLRIITRKVKFLDGSETTEPQKGSELKHEAIMRMIWIHMNAPEVFWKNITLLIAVGSWKDIFVMLRYDLIYNGWSGRKLDWEKFGVLLVSGLSNKNNCELLKKYLPSIKAKKECTTVESQANTLIGKWLCALLYGNKIDNPASTYKQYRKLKSTGTAHQWQQLISQRKFDLIDFNQIHGRALRLLVKSKFLKNQNLTEKYEAWITAPETKDVKFTGFVHELFDKMRLTQTNGELATIDKQFDTLVSKAKSNEERPKSRLIVVRDTSGSMGNQAPGTNMTCYDIAKALALYFSEFLIGEFADSWIEFNSSAQLHKWKGNTATEKWKNDWTSYVGSTDFQSVIRLFGILKASGVPEEEFPTGILCISDNEFNGHQLNQSSVDAAKSNLLDFGFSPTYVANFVIVLWNLYGYHNAEAPKFQAYGNVPNVYFFGGYNGAIISFLDGNVKNSEELFEEAMNQQSLLLAEL